MRILYPTERLIEAMIKQESAGNPKATSKKGARGLMQIMPRTWVEWCYKLGLGLCSPEDPTLNRKVGTAYIQWLLTQFDNELEISLAAYNWGIGNVKRIMQNFGQNYSDIEPHLPDETRKYVKNITANLLT